MGDKGRFCASVSPWKAATSQGRGEIELWLIFFLLFQLSAVEAGGSTAFIYANFSVPVVKVRETCMSPPGTGKGGMLLFCASSLAGSCGRACPDAKPQPWGSPICFGMPNAHPGPPICVLGCPNPISGIPALFWDAKTPTPGVPALFWGAKPQFWGSWLCFRVRNPNPSIPSYVLGVPSPNPWAPACFGVLNPNPRAPSSILGCQTPILGLPALF